MSFVNRIMSQIGFKRQMEDCSEASACGGEVYIKDGQIEFVKNYETVVRPELHKTVYYQKRFDLNDYSIEVANVKSANSEYLPQLNYGTAGTAGYEAIYNEFIAKLNSVGISKMIDGLQEKGDSYK